MRNTLFSFAALSLCAAAAFAQPANDSCASPQAISGFGQTAYDTTGAGTDGPAIACALGTVNLDVWFVWTAAISGDVLADVCTDTVHDSTMAVYEGGACPAGAELICNDDSCGLSSRVRFTAVAGQQYLIRVGGFSDGDFGSGMLTVAEAPPEGVLAGPIVNPANGHSYYLLEPSSWTEAEARAVELGGHLATVRNDEENLFIFTEVRSAAGGPGFRRLWIGLNDVAEEGTFVWSSGEPVTYTNWGGGEPNNANGTEHYVQIPWFSQAWNDNSDLPTDDPVYGVVEIIPSTCAADIGSTGGVPGADGNADNNDFVVFIDYFFGQNALADVGSTGGVPGSDGQWNNNDFVVFVDQFFSCV
ncbi:MAG TPA: GC-type dockerin domain-anchored protein [Phycisphaerales bacterium]|nr:GC-type dockerin domain-anchored protein [Phycisphaerales bacterium]